MEKTDVLGKDMEIRERSKIIVEIDAVIPYEDVVGNLAPALDGLDKFTSGSILPESHLPVAVNVAKHYVNVRKRFHVLRRLHGIEICQS